MKGSFQSKTNPTSTRARHQTKRIAFQSQRARSHAAGRMDTSHAHGYRKHSRTRRQPPRRRTTQMALWIRPGTPIGSRGAQPSPNRPQPPELRGVRPPPTGRVREGAGRRGGFHLRHPHHRGHQEQHDAPEYLMWMLDALHTATNAYTSHHQNNNRFNHVATRDVPPYEQGSYTYLLYSSILVVHLVWQHG